MRKKQNRRLVKRAIKKEKRAGADRAAHLSAASRQKKNQSIPKKQTQQSETEPIGNSENLEIKRHEMDFSTVSGASRGGSAILNCPVVQKHLRSVTG